MTQQEIKLWKHQEDALKWSEDQKGFIYGFDPGLGKTKTAITQLLKWHDKHSSLFTTLIICPNSIVEQWREEIIKEAPHLGAFTTCLRGPSKKRIKELEDYYCKIFITNYESLDTVLYLSLIHI